MSFSASIQNSIEGQYEYEQEQKLARQQLNAIQEMVIKGIRKYKELKEDRGDIGDGDTYLNNKEEPPKEANV